MEMDDTTVRMNLSGPLYAIDERSNIGIPAVQLDTATGARVVLIFTSKDAAKKYCYLRNPDAVSNIFELTRRTLDGEIVQTGLIKIARVLYRDYPEVSSFVIDHPGTKGPASYLSVEDAVFLGRDRNAAESPDNFESALDSALGE